MVKPRIVAAVVAALCLCVGGSARAASAPLRTYTDANGIVHITNLKGNKSKARKAQAGPRGALVPMVLLDAVVAECADLYQLPHALVKAVIATESNYNPWAVSEKGAVGLMQLMPQTAREMFVEDPFDPVQNIQGGTRYLRVLVNQFDGDLVKVLAAYNAGPEVVKRAEMRAPTFVVPAIPETQEYVRRVLQNYEILKAMGAPADAPREAHASRERS
jgi:soluble lytic murein transglycosylase-like protein